jgi:DNA-binding SARP family transcriptional activator/TolB-like protein/Tfp pilus assembly protein PilF
MRKKLAATERSKIIPLNRGRAEQQQESGRALVRVHVLGSMRATTYLGAEILPRGKKAKAILGYLSLTAGERASRARLAAILWDRTPDVQARSSFRQALHELLLAMGPLADELISADRETVKLNANLCWIDAAAILAPETTSASSSRSELSALCTGELLEELDGISAPFDQWLLGERTRFTQQLSDLLEAELNDLARSKTDLKQQVSNVRRLIAFDPTHEGASRALMRALAKLGERAQALREYERCRRALRKALDVEPSPETRALADAIRTFSGRGAQHEPAPPLQTPLEQGSKVRPAPAHRRRLRLGVLPFLATRARDDQNLAFSLSQEIAAGLARFRWFDVIAPASLARRTLSHLSEDLLKQKELDYVVDGALSGNGKRFQISVRLLDVTQFACPVWSDRFELASDELHQLDERVTARIVGRIDPVILFIEGQPRRRKHYGATGLLLRAIPLMYSMERDKYEQAGQLINRALKIDPDDAMILAWAAHWQVYHVGQGWSQNAGQSFAIAQKCAASAIRRDPENAEALGIYAHVCAFLDKDFDSALHYFERALRVNPNLAFVWSLSALTYCYVGEPDIALERLERHRDLTPIEPYPALYDNPYAIAYLIKRDYEQAAVFGRRVTKARPEFVNGYKPLIAALGHLGRKQEAKLYIDKLLSLEPGFTVERFGQVYPFKHASDREHYMVGLRLAGVPERAVPDAVAPMKVSPILCYRL